MEWYVHTNTWELDAKGEVYTSCVTLELAQNTCMLIAILYILVL